MAEPPAHDWKTIAAEASTLHGAPDRTLEPREASIGTTGRRALAAYEAVPDEPGLQLGEVLGEGGRGIVRAAVQTSMGREVAVKAVRPALRRPGPTLELLQEAWIAGRLEHPNIVPVYDIARDADGSPLIVLKRIEGEAWSDLFKDPTRARARLDASDAELLDAHVQILIAVCNAIHYAHDRRILHLDLKPENVMIGSHGEVYVVDWGVAAALEDPGGKLPLTTKRRGIVGTPSYMAPEMAAGDGALLDERTDVYLLGAILFELLAGRPPHAGETIMAVLYAVVHEQPSLPADAPAELAAICRRAMAREPSERFASADALRHALQGFLGHRGSTRLAAQADARLTELEVALDSASSEQTDRRHELFAQVRFGFEQALATWPDNQRARAGLLRAFSRMIEHELEHGDAQVGADLAAQIQSQLDASLDPELLARIEQAVARRRAGLHELEQLRRDRDLRVGQRTRVFVVLVLGLFWTIMPLLEHVWLLDRRSHVEGYAMYIATELTSLAILGGLRIWARDSLTRSRINRVVISTMAVLLLGQTTLLLGGMAAGLAPIEALAPGLLLAGALIAVASLVVDLRALPLSIVYAASYAVSVVRPDQVFLALALSNLILVIVLGIAWRPEKFRGPIAEPDHRA